MSRVSTRLARSSSATSSSYSPPVSGTSAPSGLSRRRRSGSRVQPAKRSTRLSPSGLRSSRSPVRRITARIRAISSRGLNGLGR